MPGIGVPALFSSMLFFLFVLAAAARRFLLLGGAVHRPELAGNELEI
jgi:hypothetical protein